MPRWIAVLAFATSLLPGSAQAEDEVTWIAFSKTKEGKLQDAVQMEVASGAPMLDRLMADGTITSWGLATYVNHHSADFRANLVQWVTAPGWEGIGKWADQVGEMMAGLTPEAQQELTARAAEVYESRSHYDEIVRDAVYLPGDPSTGSPPRYLYLTSLRARPGQAQAGTQLFQEVVGPVATRLVAEGTMTGYGLQVREVRSGEGFSHRSWLAFPSLAGLDRYHSEIDAAVSPETGARAAAAFHWEERQNDILMILHLGGGRAGQ